MKYFSFSQPFHALSAFFRRLTLSLWKHAIPVPFLVCLLVIGLFKTQAQAPIITTQQGYPNGQSVNGIAYGNGTYIAGVNSTTLFGSLYTSTDGTNWSKIVSPSIPTDMYFSGGGAYGNGVFVFAGNAGKIITSSDNGASWTSQTSGTTMDFIDIQFLNGAFYVVGLQTTGTVNVQNNVVLSSPDGVTWTKVLEVLNSNQNFNSIAYGSGAYVLAYGIAGTGGMSIYRSTTGASGSWTSQSINPSESGTNGVDFVKDRFFIFGVGSTVFTSTNGSSWTNITSNTINLPNGSTSTFAGGATQFTQAVSDGTTYYLIGTHQYYNSNGTVPAPSPSGVVLTSTNATTFTLQSKSVSATVNEAVYLNDKFFMCTGTGPLYSADGINYVYSSGGFYGVAGNGTGYALVGQGSSSEGVVFSSTNFSSFSQTAAFQNTVRTLLTAVIHDGSKYVAVGQGGTVATSVNGTTWTVGSTGYTDGTDNLNSIAYGNGAYVAVGNQGSILRSTNGTNWSQISKDASTGSNYYSVRYLNGMFIAVGGSTATTGTARVAYSTDGSSWTNSSPSISITGHFHDIAYNGTSYLLIGRLNSAAATSRMFFSTTTSDITNSTFYMGNVTTIDGYSNSANPLGNSGFGALVYTNGKFVAVQNQSVTPFSAYVLVSSDSGLSWTAYDAGTTGRLRGAFAENNKVRIVGFSDVKVTVEFASTPSNPAVNLSVSSNTGTEADATSITVTATASAAVSGAQTVTLTVSGTNITTGDYTLNNTTTNNVTITIPDGGTAGTATFKVVNDDVEESTETAVLTLSSPSSGITLGSALTQDITITNLNKPDYCNLQFPTSITVSSGATTPVIYGRIFETGVTSVAGASSQVTAQVGYGPSNTDPRSTSGWVYTNASFSMQVGNDDEYQATFTAPSVAGSYSYVYRFSLNGGANWTYADTDGAGTNSGLSFSVNNMGSMTVTPSPNNMVANGPLGSPEATGPTDNNDDFSNKSSFVPPGTSPASSIDPQSVGFTNTVKNTSTSSVNISLRPSAPTTLSDLPTNTIVTLSYSSASATYTYNGTTFVFLSGIGFVAGNPIDGTNPIQISGLAANATATYGVEIDLPPGTPLSTNSSVECGFPVTITAFIDANGNGSADDAVQNKTIDRVYTGFLQQLKQSRILQGTGPAVQGSDGTLSTTSKKPAFGNIIEYQIQFKNISDPSAGVGNITLDADKVVVTEDGSQAPNNWAVESAGDIYTSHIVGSVLASSTGTTQYFSGNPATNLLGGEQTGTTASTDVTKYRHDWTGKIASGTSRTLSFQRKVNQAASGQAISNTVTATYEDPNNPNTPINTTSNRVDVTVLPAVNLSVSTNNASEGAATMITVTATASVVVPADQTVTLGVSGTGITTGDYTLSLTTITIPAGSNSGSVTFTVIDDALAEGTETATLTISSPSSGISLGTTTTQNIAITDNDIPAAVCITTDCAAYNGNYTRGTDYNGRPSYTNGTAHIFQAGASWYVGKGALGATQLTDIVFEAPSIASLPPTAGWGANEDNECVDATFALAQSACPCVNPTAFTVSGGGSYCAGGTGVAVGLSNSETGVNYQLKKDGSNVGSAVAGTGSALPFGNQTGAGTYTVEATTTTGGCTATMTGSVTVTVISLPTAYNVTGGGSYCAGGTGVAVGLSNSQTGVNYQLKKDGSNVGSAVAGTGSALPFGNQTGAGTYTVEATKATGSCVATMTGSVTVTVISLPTVYNVTGGGSYCAGGTGVAVGLSNSQTGVNYQLKKDGSNVGGAVAGTGSALPFGSQTGAGTYTVEATIATGGCTATMTGSVTVTVISLPTAYSVTGGGSYCAGGTGVAVGLSNSQTGVNYQLKKDGSNVGSAVAGTGSALPFGSQTGAGTYTVEATTATGGCTATMTGSVTVTVISLPTAYNVTGGGSYCAGGTGVAVGLSNSQTGVNYQLKKDGSNVGSVVAGTGSALPFGNQTGAGTYTVEATTATGGCTATMTGSMTVTVISLPTAYNVTGGGSYCAGGTGVAVGLSNSQTGVNYQLKKDGSNVGSVVAGTGSALSFGNQTDAGIYTVEATTTTGGCVATMSGSATVSINALPTAFSVTGGGSYCQGGTGVLVGLSSSATGINYQLKLGDAVVGSSLPGTGSALSFGLQTSLGTYMVVATNAATNCTLGMTGTAQVASYPLPLATVSGTTTACKGGASSILTFTGSNGTAPYTFSYQLNGGTVQTVTTTGGSSTTTVSQSSSVEGVYNYTLVSVSDANCSQTQSGSAVVRVQTKPVITLTTLQQTLNEGNSQTFCDTDANPVNGLQFAVTGSCVVGNPVWRVQVGSGAWSDWSATAPVTQPSNNQPHRYQAACDASCAVTYTNPIEVTINYRASVPQNVSLLVDGVVVNAGETKDICNVEGNAITFNASCGVGEVLVYSVDGGDYTSVVPTQMVDGQYHNYRVRCRKSDNVLSCIETESNVLRFRLTSMSMVPLASLNVTSGCGLATSFIGTSNCGSMSTIWYNAVTNEALAGLPSQTPSETTSYYVRCQAIGGCMSEKSNVVTYTVASVSEVPVVVVSADVVCTGVEVTVSTSCPAGSSALWNTGVTENSFKVSFANVTKQSYSVRCVYANGCQSSVSASKEVMWKAFELTLINIGESKSGTKTNSRSAWSGQFVTPDAGPSLDQSTQANPTVYFSENLNKTAPRYWTIHVDACVLGESGSLTYDLLATPETGIVRSYNTHENSAPYFMFANRSGWTELYAQNHPLYGFYADNGSGGNVYDEGFPKGLYKLGIRYWDMKGWGSIYPSTRKPQGNVLAYQEYWFRIQSKDGIGVGAARTAESGEQGSRGEGQVVSDNGQPITDNSAFATVLPNPVSNVLRLKVQESKGQVVQTTLTDVSGRAILHRQFVPETNTHQEEFGVSELPKGMYFLQVTTSEKRDVLKVIKL
ncbi:hypothetical protein FHS57_005373 [Runella defluvii]|uniref:Secretion system C-terminal sorting domain-containing protein n=1 Tax=Runella defluvii TaxID=370973 RepID=A0A7W5ZRA3_9BACT|nr:T9SS type A sorting domain-containing protein [Runella defluvii]MBB3841345.1 hypothetical protein [Runella defluvii]